MTSTSGYQPLRRTGRLRLQWQLLRRMARMDPAWPWWAVWAGGGTAVGVVADLVDVAPWWVGPPVGLVGGVLVVAATALDDIRRPVASLRVVAAEIRHPRPRHPGRADAVRAAAFGIPLFAPEGVDNAWLRGGGASYGPRLFSPSRPRIRVGWGRDPAGGTAVTAVGEDSNDRWVHDGWFRTRSHDDWDDETGERPWPGPEVHDAVVPWTVHLDGVAHETRAVDLGPWDGGWAATVRIDDRHELALTGHGRLPADLRLTRRAPSDLVGGPDRP